MDLERFKGIKGGVAIPDWRAKQLYGMTVSFARDNGICIRCKKPIAFDSDAPVDELYVARQGYVKYGMCMPCQEFSLEAGDDEFESGPFVLSGVTFRWVQADRRLLDLMPDYHVLTYADSDLSSLSFHGLAAGLDLSQIREFAQTVSSSRKVESLAPMAFVSALPTTLVLGPRDKFLVCSVLKAFFASNAFLKGPQQLILDFRVRSVLSRVLDGIDQTIVDLGAAEAKRIFDGVMVIGAAD